MNARRRRTMFVLGAGVALMVTGMVWVAWSPQAADRGFDPQVSLPAVRGRWRPQVVIDQGHLQTTELPDGTLLRFGMNRDDTDNRQFTLNLLHWTAMRRLTRILFAL